MSLTGRRPARRAAALLSKGTRRYRRWSGAGAAKANLVIVGAFALVAVILLTKVVFDARGIDSDIDDAITPQLTAVDVDLDAVPALDRTGMLTERIAAAILPIAGALGRSADATAATARDAEDVRHAAPSIREQVAGIDASVTAIRASLGDLAPLVAAIAAGTGDLRAALSRTRVQTAQAATGVGGILDKFGAILADTRTAAARIREIEGVYGRIEAHSANVAAAKILNCPDDPRACLP